MARTYKRDNRGRFASGGTNSSGAKAKAAKPPTRGRNRITRDNAGRITSVGGQGATARGGRLKTAAGNKRGAVVAKMSLRRGGVVGKPKGLKPGTLKGRVAADPKKAGSIYNIPLNQLKRYRALTSAEYKHRKEFRDQADRSFSAYDKRDSQGMAKASKRSDVAFRRSERMRSTLRKLSGAGPEGKAPKLPTIQYMRPKSKQDRKDQGYIVRENGRLKSSLYPKGGSGKARRVDLVKMTGIKGMVRAPKAKPSAKPNAPTGPVRPSGRTRKQVAAAYRFKTNQLGKETAAKLGFSAALQRGQRGGFVDSAPRRIFRRGKNRQMTLTGGVETVRTGRMREVGRRNSAGKVVLTPLRRRRR